MILKGRRKGGQTKDVAVADEGCCSNGRARGREHRCGWLACFIASAAHELSSALPPARYLPRHCDRYYVAASWGAGHWGGLPLLPSWLPCGAVIGWIRHYEGSHEQGRDAHSSR